MSDDGVEATGWQTVGRLRFVAPKDGDTERILKARLSALFAEAGGVLRAYLVLARAGTAPVLSVVLGLRLVEGGGTEILPSIADVFHQEFANGQYLDMAILDDALEAEVRDVCSPFYIAAPSGSNWWARALRTLK
jgi:SseB protein C-terminal domain